MISRIKIVKSSIEQLLDKINSNWKTQILYRWQYGGEHPPELAIEEIYNLGEFKKFQEPPHILYVKENKFILKETKEPFTNVLTNIEPPTKDRWIYNSKTEIREFIVNDLFKI